MVLKNYEKHKEIWRVMSVFISWSWWWFHVCVCKFIKLHTSNMCSLLCNSSLFSGSVMSDSLQPHGLQHSRLPCPSLTPGAYSNSCPLSQWCLPTISFSVVPFSFHLQSFPASRSSPVSQFFTSGGQSIGASASASVLPVDIQDWCPLGMTGLIFLLSLYINKAFKNCFAQKLFSASPLPSFSPNLIVVFIPIGLFSQCWH